MSKVIFALLACAILGLVGCANQVEGVKFGEGGKSSDLGQPPADLPAEARNTQPKGMGDNPAAAPPTKP